MEKNSNWESTQKKLYAMVSTGVVDNPLNQFYDIFSTLALVANLVCAFAATFDSVRDSYGTLLDWVDEITVAFFAIDYILRLLTASQHFKGCSKGEAVTRYVTSGYGIIDLLSFLPHYMPTFFPAGATVFRMFRVVRIFRLFRINAYSDSLTLIGNVVSKKKTQLLASVFVIIMLILAASLCMYSVEHDAQPDVFENAFSAIWWATSTLLTVGYGDIYPITVMGQILGILITFLGVGLVAIPTGILSAGFVEEYQNAVRLADIEQDNQVSFIKAFISDDDAWAHVKIRNTSIPKGFLIALIYRGSEPIVPRGDIEILPGDLLIICAESATEGMLEDVKEITLHANHSWNGKKIKDLNISRKTVIILVDRDSDMLKPNGDLVLLQGDKIILYTQENIRKYKEEPLF